MAEAVLEVVLKNLSSLIHKQLGIFLGFDQDFKSLSSLLTTIKATLEDAEEKQFSNKAIKDWLHKLKDAAYVLDDILDECATQALKLECKRFKYRQSHKVHSSFLSSFHPKHVAFRYKIAKKMKNIRERLDEIAAERSKFHLSEMIKEKRGRVLDWRQTTSIITQPQVYGRDEHKDKIVDFLVGGASQLEDLSVYPILGLGGLGKTTLAQLVFNYERIVNHFEMRIWVCVSEDFSLKRMTKAIIESATKNACEDLDLEPLQRQLQELLQRKRFLLVLDDVWDYEQENWQRLRSVLACGGKGASILVTTRLAKVATIMGTMSPHELSTLSDIHCWELFKQRALGPNEEERAELVIIGKEILKKCGGVPLAAIALGSLLRFKREEKDWLYIKESKLWSLHDEDYVMPALRLSYLNLPIKLRQCFAFCALFPKNARISKQYLIELWMANGFISSNEMLGEEDIGNEVWNELYWRSFFQDIETDIFGKDSFKMHDLVHDLAQFVSDEVCCIADNDGMPTTSERIRHLTFYRGGSFREVDLIRLQNVKSLKTYTTSGVGHDKLLPHILTLYSLRVLELKYIKEVPSSIGYLKYLRHLNLSFGDFETLPESVCELWNLQILKLDNCYRLQSLPKNLIHLKYLESLSLNRCRKLSCLPPQIGKLTLLKTLSMFIVGKKRGFLLAELGQLDLKGGLHIKHLERVKSVTDAKEANMSSKHLNYLKLSWERFEESQLQEYVEQILEVLQPAHTQQLRRLCVEGYTGVQFPQWISSLSLKDLQYLYLNDCENCLNLPQLGKLSSLKELTVSNMSRIIYIDEESYDNGIAGGFIALKYMSLNKLPNLISLSWEEKENMFTCLSILQITECPKLSRLPCLPSLCEMGIQGKCNRDLLCSIDKLSSLKCLRFKDNEELTCFPYGMLQSLTSLKIFDIYGLSRLELLTDELLQGLYSLKRLCIRKCQKLNMSASFQHLTCLEELVIQDLPQIEGLHEALQHLTALHSLTLEDLPNLSSLPDWLGNLSLLYQLKLFQCPKLRCLPMSFQSLTGLKILKIHRCGELEKRCEKENGEDWPKIAHIQTIEIQDW